MTFEQVERRCEFSTSVAVGSVVMVFVSLMTDAPSSSYPMLAGIAFIGFLAMIDLSVSRFIISQFKKP